MSAVDFFRGDSRADGLTSAQKRELLELDRAARAAAEREGRAVRELEAASKAYSAAHRAVLAYAVACRTRNAAKERSDAEQKELSARVRRAFERVDL